MPPVPFIMGHLTLDRCDATIKLPPPVDTVRHVMIGTPMGCERFAWRSPRPGGVITTDKRKGLAKVLRSTK